MASGRPSASTSGNLFIVSAPSGGGKTSLTRALLPRLATRGIDARISVSYTTRSPRPGEQDGVDYHFVDVAEFVAMIGRGEFLEHAEVFGRRYGTGRAQTERMLQAGCDVILDIDWQGAQQVRHNMPAARSIFILPPSRAELERRLRTRGQDAEGVVRQRMAEARSEMAHYADYDFLVVNDAFERALAELEEIFVAGRRGEPTQVDQLRVAVQAERHGRLIAALLANESPVL